MSERQPISTGSDWTFELIPDYDRELARVAKNYGLDTYPNQIEIISAEQMLDAYSSVGMPVGYPHRISCSTWATTRTIASGSMPPARPVGKPRGTSRVTLGCGQAF